MPVMWLSKEKCMNMLPFQAFGHLATVGEDNRPYVTPLNYVYFDNAIYFHTKFTGRKLENIRRNSRVSFNICAKGNLYVSEKACGFSMRFWSILIEGRAEEVTDPSVKRTAIEELMNKYGRGFEFEPATDEDIAKVNVVRIEIEEMTGKMGVDPQ